MAFVVAEGSSSVSVAPVPSIGGLKQFETLFLESARLQQRHDSRCARQIAAVQLAGPTAHGIAIAR
jgi:hypothetical protein